MPFTYHRICEGHCIVHKKDAVLQKPPTDAPKRLCRFGGLGARSVSLGTRTDSCLSVDCNFVKTGAGGGCRSALEPTCVYPILRRLRPDIPLGIRADSCQSTMCFRPEPVERAQKAQASTGGGSGLTRLLTKSHDTLHILCYVYLGRRLPPQAALPLEDELTCV